MPVRIDELDPTSPRDLGDAAALMTIAWRIALLDDTEPDYPVKRVASELLGAGWLAREGGQAVALCTLKIVDGAHAVMPELWVLPSHRRRKIGTSLLDRAVALARSSGSPVLEGSHYEGAPASIAFAQRHGAEPKGVTEQLRARIEDVDVAALGTTGARIEQRPEIGCVEAWDDGTNATVSTALRGLGFRPVAVWRDVELRIS